MKRNDQDLIYHIVTQSEWQTAVSKNSHTPLSIEQEGFIHCSTKDQLLIPANERFHGQTDLILLQIDPKKVDHKLVFEDCYESGIKFPHIYGDLKPDSVVQTIPFPSEKDGTFKLPKQLR